MRLSPALIALLSLVQSDGFVIPRGSSQISSSRQRFDAPKLLNNGPSSTVLNMADAATSVSIEQVKEELLTTQAEFTEKLEAASTVADAEALRREYLGKKGPINKSMGYMRQLSPEDKPKLGSVVNEVKANLEGLITESKERLEMAEMEELMLQEKIDVTMPGLYPSADIGRRHPLSMTMEKALDIFVKLGYDTITAREDSPEIETDYYCFEALNCPKDHPARDMQDTFYLQEDRELMLGDS